MTKYTLEDAKKININLSPFFRCDLQRLNGWSTDFILAGEFIHDVLTDTKRSNMDFYIFTENGFNTLLDFFSSKTIYTDKYTYAIKTHYIEIISEYFKNNIIRLINAFNLTPIDIMNAMEIDILRCFYDGDTIYQFNVCEGAIESIEIHANNNNNCCPITILKAIDKGYEISHEILEGLGIRFNNRPISPSRYERDGEYDDHYEIYRDSLEEYLYTAVMLTKEQMSYLYELCETKQKENCKYITLYDVEMTKYFLHYIYKHSIKNLDNINCGCFEYTEMADVLHTA
jgi:hypothetical protein